MATWQNFLDSIGTGQAAGAGIGATQIDDPTTDANAPDLDDQVEASADRAEHAGDGPDVGPVYEPARPILDETHLIAILDTVRSTLLGVPVPAGSIGQSTAVAATTPVQVLAAAGGRPRSVTIRNLSTGDVVYLSPDRREDDGGYALAAGAELETVTQGAVWAWCATGDATVVSAWSDHYARP